MSEAYRSVDHFRRYGESKGRKRLIMEFEDWKNEHPTGIIAEPMDTHNEDGVLEKNYLAWHASVKGPDNTAWAGAFYNMLVQFSDDYPHTPPIVRFTPTICHINLMNSGVMIASFLHKDWSPTYTVPRLLMKVQDTLHNFDPVFLGDTCGAMMYANDRYDLYLQRVRMLSYCMGSYGADLIL